MNTMPALLQAARSALDDLVRQLVPVVFLPWKILREQSACALNSFHQRIGERFTLEVLAHRRDEAVPEFDAAFLVNAFVADDRELPRPWRDKDEDGVSFRGVRHSEFVKLLRREFERI